MAYFTDYAVEAKFDGVSWTRWNEDIIGTIHGEYGIFGNGSQDRVGDIGGLKFDLNNTETNSAGLVGYYSPGHVNYRAGFAPGLPVRITFTLDKTTQKLIGTIPVDGISVQTGVYSSRHTSVTVTDWFDQANIHKITTLQFAENKTFQEAVALILANMPIQPPGTVTYHTGESTFPTVFDITKAETTALGEMGKLAKSELGYIYMTRNGLEVEGRMTRNYTKFALDDYPHARDGLGLLINEDADYVVDEEGDRILLSDSTNAIFTNQQYEADVSYGAHYYNQVKFTVYPRRVDADADVILFNLNSPTKIEAGETLILQGRYSDPTGVSRMVNGIDMVTPVANTHYLAFENDDGTGTNYTADLVVTAVFGTSEFTYAIENTSAADCYITKCQAVGRGVYTDASISYYTEDPAGILAYGGHNVSLDMKYQSDAGIARLWARILLLQYSTLSSYVNSISFHGSLKQEYLYAFVYIEPGDRVRIVESVSGIYGDYFVQGVKFDIGVGGTIDFTWVLKSFSLDTFIYAQWDLLGTWDDDNYGWDY